MPAPQYEPDEGYVWKQNDDGTWSQVPKPAPTDYQKVTAQGTWTRLNDPTQSKIDYEMSTAADGSTVYRMKGEGAGAWRDKTTFWNEWWVDLNRKPAAPVAPPTTQAVRTTNAPAVSLPVSQFQRSQQEVQKAVVNTTTSSLTDSIPRGNTAQATPKPVAKYKRTRRNPKDAWKQGI
jgi:hypothetical protein